MISLKWIKRVDQIEIFFFLLDEVSGVHHGTHGRKKENKEEDEKG